MRGRLRTTVPEESYPQNSSRLKMDKEINKSSVVLKNLILQIFKFLGIERNIEKIEAVIVVKDIEL